MISNWHLASSGGQVPVIFETVSAAAKEVACLFPGLPVRKSTTIIMRWKEVPMAAGHGLRLPMVKGRGNSNTLVNYQSFDARPVIGRNLYRIRQVDVDGTAKYSVTVSANVKAGSTAISLLSNPVGRQATLRFSQRQGPASACTHQRYLRQTDFQPDGEAPARSNRLSHPAARRT